MAKGHFLCLGAFVKVGNFIFSGATLKILGAIKSKIVGKVKNFRNYMDPCAEY